MKKVIDLSSDDDDDCGVMNLSPSLHSVFSHRGKEADKVASSSAMFYNAKGGRVVQETKKLVLIPIVCAASKESRVGSQLCSPNLQDCCPQSTDPVVFQMKKVIDLSSDDDDDDNCGVMNLSSSSHSGFAYKRKEADEMASSSAICRNAKGGSVVPETKKLKLALIPSACAASKKRRVKENRKANELAMIPAANAPEQRVIVDKKVRKVAVASYKKIPRVILLTMKPRNEVDRCKSEHFNMHSSLARRKVILYGLPGFYITESKFHKWEFRDWNLMWGKFFATRVMPPVFEFIRQAEILKASGVNQILFITVNPVVMSNATHRQPSIRSMYPYVQFLADLNGKDNKKSFYRGMGLEFDICEGWIPARTRKVILLVDDLKVKYSNIESSDQVFLPPTFEEIIQVFNS